METVAVEEMGAAEALHAFGDLRRARDRAERDLLRLAAHFADLYNVDADAPNRHTLPGTERPVEVGGDGAPRVLEFAIAEAATELGTTSHSTKRLIGDALDLPATSTSNPSSTLPDRHLPPGTRPQPGSARQSTSAAPVTCSRSPPTPPEANSSTTPSRTPLPETAAVAVAVAPTMAWTIGGHRPGSTTSAP